MAAESRGVVSLWVGDSFTGGEGAFVPARLTYPHLVSEQLGWQCHVDAQNGTGLVNDGYAASPDWAPLIQRLPADVRRWNADVVIVDAGRNDVEASTPDVRRAAEEYLSAVRSAYPNARIVMIMPTLVDAVQPPEYQRIAAVLRAVAPTFQALVVDPAEAGAFRDPVHNRTLVCTDGFHPSAAGQAHYARVLLPLLQQVLRQS